MLVRVENAAEAIGSRMSRRAISSGSAIGAGKGFSGRAFAMPWWGRWEW
ncbi:hypothetical protein [Streptomyces hirsutus]